MIRYLNIDFVFPVNRCDRTKDILDREGSQFGTWVKWNEDNTLDLELD